MTLETDSKIIAQQYLAKYGKAEAIKILVSIHAPVKGATLVF